MRRFCFVLFGILLTYSCGKDPLTQPTSVVFNIKMQNTSGFYATADSGSVFVSNFEFAGAREVGQGVYFNSSLDSSLYVPFVHDVESKVFQYDIPIGTYSKIITKVSFLFDSRGMRNIYPRLQIYGQFKNSKGNRVPFIFNFSSEKVLELEAYSSDGGKVILNLGKQARADLILDSEKLFVNVQQKAMENADLTSINGVPTVVISASTNITIYYEMVSNIDRTFELLFNATI